MRQLVLFLTLVTGCQFAPQTGPCSDGLALDEIAVYYADCDGDGYGRPDLSGEQFCQVPDSVDASLVADCEGGQWVLDNSDCDDTDPTQNHADIDGDKVSTCDGDCNDLSWDYKDEALWFRDCDGDGDYASEDPVTSCLMPVSAPCEDGESPDGGWTREVEGPFDCDDTDPTQNHADADQDGFTTCQVNQTDCDDDPLACGPDCSPGNTNPDICDGYDNNCNGDLDEDPDITWFRDVDQDGSPVGAPVLQCDSPGPDYTLISSETPDCDDTDPMVESLDLDGDGFTTCNGDCNDEDSGVYPGALDLVEDGIDNDCDGIAGVDEDADGFASIASGGTDCNDDSDDPISQLVRPDQQERCDEVDWDCDGQAVPTTPTVTLWSPAPLARANVPPDEVLDASGLDPAVEGVQVCGTLDGWGIIFPSRDFVLRGLNDSQVCALTDQPALSLSALDSQSAVRHEINNLTLTTEACDRSGGTAWLPALEAIGTPEASTLVLEDVNITGLIADGTAIEIAHYDSELTSVSFANNDVTRLATIDGGITSMDSISVTANRLLETGIRVQDNTSQPTFLFLNSPVSRSNSTNNGELRQSAVFDIHAPSSVSHRFYTTPPALPPSLCAGPDGAVISPPRVLRQPDHEQNNVQTFRFRNDVDLTGGYFRNNLQTPVFLGSPVNETASGSVADAFFVGNEGGNAGALWIYSENIAKSWFTVVNGTHFQQNHSLASGGAITMNAGGSTVTSGNWFCQNSAATEGGAIIVSSADGTEGPAQSLSSTQDLIERNSATQGGGLSLYSGFFVASSTWFGRNQSDKAPSGEGHAIIARGDSVILATDLKMQDHVPVGDNLAGSHIELLDTSLLNLSRVEYYFEEQSTIDTTLGCYAIPKAEPLLIDGQLKSIECDAEGECTYVDSTETTFTAVNTCR